MTNDSLGLENSMVLPSPQRAEVTWHCDHCEDPQCVADIPSRLDDKRVCSRCYWCFGCTSCHRAFIVDTDLQQCAKCACAFYVRNPDELAEGVAALLRKEHGAKVLDLLEQQSPALAELVRARREEVKPVTNASDPLSETARLRVMREIEGEAA